MFFMRFVLSSLLFILFCFLSVTGNAQTYYQLTATSGTQTIGGNTVTVTSSGSATNEQLSCIGPYRPSLFAPGGYKYVFSNPVSNIRALFLSVGNDDTVVIKLNGVSYSITSANLSNFSNCFLNSTPTTVIAYNGLLTGTTTADPNQNIQFDVSPGYPIDSVEIDEINSIPSGVIYSFYFAISQPCPGNLNISHDSACSGQSLHLSVSTTGVSNAATYSWTGPNGFISPQINPTVSNVSSLSTGTYVLTVNDTGCVYKDSISITTYTISALSAINNGPLCPGDTLKLKATDLTPGLTYSWTGPASYSSSIQNPQVINAMGNNSGTYTVSASLNGCTVSATTSAVINPILGAPVATISSSLGNIICVDSTTTFTVTTTNTVNATYQWKRNSVDIPGATGAAYTPSFINDMDIFSCFITSNAPCQPVNTGLSNAITMHKFTNATLSVTISVYPSTFTPGDTTVFTAQTTSNTGLSFQWRDNGINIPGATTSTYSTDSLHAGDVISVFVTSSIPCTFPDTISSNLISLVVPGISIGTINLSLYPNPNNGIFTIQGTATTSMAFEVFNVLGQLITKNVLLPQQDIINEHFDLNSIPDGLYLLRLSNNTYSKTIPFIVNK